MKVLRIIDTFYPFISGPSKEAYHFSLELQKKNIESPVFTTILDAPTAPLEETMDGIKIRRFPIKFRIMRFVYSSNYAKSIEEEQADIFHIHNYRSYQSYIGYKIAKKRKIPYVINPCGGLLGYQAYLKGWKTLPYKIFDFLTRKQIIMSAAKVIVESDIEFAEAKKFGVPEEKICIIPFGINVSTYYNEKKDFKVINTENPLKLLFVGRIARNRNLEPIIRSLKNLENIKMRIVGEESEISSALKGNYISELKELVSELGLSHIIEFTGAKYGQELINEYKNADCFIYTSLAENFGQPIQEAAAAGLSLICTPVGITSSIIYNGKSGYFVDFNDPTQIAEKIEILKSPEIRKNFNLELKQIMLKEFNWDNVIIKLIEIYKEAINSV